MNDPCPIVSPLWWQWHYPVGAWIALLALLGVVVPWFRPTEKMSRVGKAAWSLLMFVSFYMEIRTLYLDRDMLSVNSLSNSRALRAQ